MDDLAQAFNEKWTPNATSREDEAREKEEAWRRKLETVRKTEELRGCMKGLQIGSGGNEKKSPQVMALQMRAKGKGGGMGEEGR
ncbi:hypothetical protein PMIN06_005392 [Paraphaeosphaeria minitans]|uniref:Uncharacterized protein n=1 Tax=Paraphaeosphaeria minitans TaxID=565426 RepID=A0A9P6GB50_9PLEO|nr:hypothetical protein PMIN01_10093 [Paraphaeosphaeria minitans]